MGEHINKSVFDSEERKAFVRHLIDDVKALEILLERGLVEDDVVRIGAEQEICLVDDEFRPSPKSLEIIETIDDPHFTTELANYNLEANLDPFLLEKECFQKVERQLGQLLDKAKVASKEHQSKVVLTGILPTISKEELGMVYMTPIPRYYKLNDTLKMWRGDDFSVRIRGVDELSIHHDSVLFEACNTSFQLHLQVAPEDFIKSYNWSQAIAGPVLGVSCNSPLLLGKELWKETRIALFQQSLDTRKWSHAVKEQVARVGFGEHWQKGSVVNIFKEDISTHRIVLTKPIGKSALQLLEEGKIPKLEALNLFNGTVYRWNRPCYGVGNGKPHVRIENRYIPAGPSMIDQMANFAFWIGLMEGRPKAYDDLPNVMDFKEVRQNFINAARNGRQAQFSWQGKNMTLKKLIKNELLPIAHKGLKKHQINENDINRLLGIIEARVNGPTGAEWQINNFRRLRKQMKLDSALVQLTKAQFEQQQNNVPVHQWRPVQGIVQKRESFQRVGQIMSTRLLKMYGDDYANLALSIMQWNNIHHLPVENTKGELVGLLTWSHIDQMKTLDTTEAQVSDIMIKKVITATPKMKIETAKKMMQDHQIGCLPVCEGSSLVGIISKVDL